MAKLPNVDLGLVSEWDRQVEACQTPAQWIALIVFWLNRYIAFARPEQALAVALWTVNSWTFRRFTAVPYMAIWASTKQAGKSTLKKLALMLCQNPVSGGATAAASFRLLDMYDGKLTIMWDEAEKMSGAALDTMRQFINLGYLKGDTMPRAIGSKVIPYEVFCPKGVVLIGQPNDTLRDRSIMIELSRGIPREDMDEDICRAEANDLVSIGRQWLSESFAQTIPIVKPTFLVNRDRQIWTPIFSLAAALQLPQSMVDDLTRFASDLSEEKSAPVRTYRDIAAVSEGEAIDAVYRERIVRAMAECFEDGDTALWSSVLVERLKNQPAGPWRAYRGRGLNEDDLADLVRHFGLLPVQIGKRLTKGSRQVTNRNGYKRDSVMTALAKLG